MQAHRIDSLLQSIISLLYLVLLFALPLLVWTGASEVFEFPKMLLVYALTILIVASWIGRMVVQNRLVFRQSPLDIPILLFLVSQVVSTAVSIEPRTSWLGYYSRFNGGLLSTISYTLLYFGFVNNVRRISLSTIYYLLSTVLASATLVAAYAIFQRLGIDKNFWVQDVVNRVFSTQGQPNWLAAYVVMVMPLAWATMLRDEGRGMRDEGVKNQFVFLRPSAFVLWPLLLLAIIFTRSRSGLLGLLVSDVAFWSLLFLKRSDLAEQGQTFSGLRLWRPFLIAHCFLLIVFLVTNNPARQWVISIISHPQSTIQKVETTAPLLDSDMTLRKSEHGGTESGDIRRIVWTGALRLVRERPWFGFGPETFGYTYWRVRPAAHNLTSEWKFLYNKAHNEWLNLAANTGLFGLGAHLLLLGWFTAWMIRQLKSSKGQVASSKDESMQSSLTTNYLLLTTTLSALWGVESVNFFGFSTVTTQTYSYIFMAIAVTAGIRDEGRGPKENDESNSSFSLQPLALSLIVSLTTLYLLCQLAFSFFADLSYNRGRLLSTGGYLLDAIPPLDRAVELVPDEPVFRSELAQTQGLLALSAASMLTADDVKELARESIENFEIVRRENPVSLSFLKAAGRTIFSLGSIDESLYDRGTQLIEAAMHRAPTDPQLPYSLGIMFEAMEKPEDAKRSYQRALDLKPDYEEARQALTSFNEQGNTD